MLCELHRIGVETLCFVVLVFLRRAIHLDRQEAEIRQLTVEGVEA